MLNNGTRNNQAGIFYFIQAYCMRWWNPNWQVIARNIKFGRLHCIIDLAAFCCNTDKTNSYPSISISFSFREAINPNFPWKSTKFLFLTNFTRKNMIKIRLFVIACSKTIQKQPIINHKSSFSVKTLRKLQKNTKNGVNFSGKFTKRFIKVY